MKTTILSIFCLVILQPLLGQDTTYYKDQYEKKTTSAKRASFMKVSNNDNNVKNIQLWNLADSHLVYSKSYNDQSKPVGSWIFYNPEANYKYDTLTYYLNVPDTAIIFSSEADTPSGFEPAKYGDSDEEKFIAIYQNISYPREAKTHGIQGQVLVVIKIARDGKVSPYTIKKSVIPPMDYESFKAFYKLPKWDPATKDGVPIESYMVLPINFELE